MAHGYRIPPFAGSPSPEHEFVRGHVLDDLGNRAVAVLFRIFNYVADLAIRFALPDHRRGGGRQTPAGRAGRRVETSDVVILMADAAFLRGHAQTSCAAADVHGVPVAVVALPGKISSGVAVQAAWMFQDREQRGEERGVTGSGGRNGSGR